MSYEKTDKRVPLVFTADSTPYTYKPREIDVDRWRGSRSAAVQRRRQRLQYWLARFTSQTSTTLATRTSLIYSATTTRVRPLYDKMSESQATFWKITCFSLNGIPEWPNDTRVTVVGDANAVHAMTPVGGSGAKLQYVRDSALLVLVDRLITETWDRGDR